MDSHELLPPRAVIQIEEHELELTQFSLYLKGWALVEFRTKENQNGLEVLSEGLRNMDRLMIARFAWKLVADKKLVTKEAFFKFVSDDINAIKVLEALILTMNNGEPNKHYAKKLDELKKS